MQLLREYIDVVLSEGKKPFDMEEFRVLKGSDAWEYVDFRCRVLGAGVGREVFDTGLGYVIKMAKQHMPGMHQTTGGKRQNRREAGIGKCDPTAPVPKVYAYAADFSWIAVEKVKPVPWTRIDAAVRRLTKSKLHRALDLDGVIELLNTVQHPRSVAREDRNDYVKLYETSPWFASLVDLVKHCKLDPDDFHNGNWGTTDDGRLVLLDPGL